MRRNNQCLFRCLSKDFNISFTLTSLTPFNPRAPWNTHGISRELRAAGCTSCSVLSVTTPQRKQPWLPCAGFYILSLTAPEQGRLRRRNNKHHRRRQKRWKLSQLERASPPRPVLLTTTAGRLSAGAPEWGAMSRLGSFTWRCRQFLPPTRYSGTFVASVTTFISHSVKQKQETTTPAVLQKCFNFIFLFFSREHGSADRKLCVFNTISLHHIVHVKLQ